MKMANNKFEEMLEHLVNEDREKAEELFHDIVVEKSRKIYEDLLAEEVKDEEVDEASKDEEVDEASDEEVDEAHKDDKDEDEDEDKEVKEDFDLDEFEVEADDEADDAEADMDADAEMDADMGDEEPAADDAEGMEDKIADLEDELADLKAEFDAMMGGDEEGEGDDDMEMGGDAEDDMADDMEDSMDMEAAPEEMAFEKSDDEVEESDDEEVDETSKSAAEQMREYVEKVTPKMGDNGDNTKSPVAGKNDMGGDASNLVAGGEADTKGTTGGLAAPSTKEDSAGNVNVPGGKAAKSMKSMPKGHGAEKKGAGEGADNKKAVIGS